MNTKIIGKLIRQSRKEQGLTQAEAAAFMNVGTRFLSDLENGKPTVQLEKALQVLNAIGFKVMLVPKSRRQLIRRIEDELGGS